MIAVKLFVCVLRRVSYMEMNSARNADDELNC